jgi:PPM family protein phosphatase
MDPDADGAGAARRRSLSPILQNEEFKPLSSTVRVDYGACSDIRPKGAPNEDHYLIVRLGRSQETLATSLLEAETPQQFREFGYGFVVADGLGGTGTGGVASRVAISTLVHLMVHYGRWNVRVDARTAFEILERLDWVHGELDEVVKRHARSNARLTAMSTRLTGAYSAGDELFVAHSGKSGAYIFRNGWLSQLSDVPPPPQPAVKRGPRLVGDDRDRLEDVLSDAIGGEGRARVVTARYKLEDGDVLMLCSERLVESLGEERIADILTDRRDSNESCRRLVDAALEGRSAENATVILAQYRIPSRRPR